ncbi:hypothetical protein Ddc_14480 [Ditylenchus destructor]|nr:hypothetical protein Ddc_14480 [Ditylenchus destructor]
MSSTADLIGSIVSKSQCVIVIVSSILAIGLFSHTLYVYLVRGGAGLRIRALSKCMVSYMVFNTVGLAVATPMYMYPLFNLPYPQWALTLAFTHMAIEPLTVLFLALDRCLTIQFMSKRKTETPVFVWNLICNTACILSIVLPISIGYLLNLSVDAINTISFYRSMYIFSFKMTIGVLNAGACAFLCWKVKSFRKKNISNTIVLVSCMTELLLEFFPNLTASVIVMTGNGYIFKYTGPYATTTQCINVMICAIIYSRTLHAKRGLNEKTEVTRFNRITTF